MDRAEHNSPMTRPTKGCSYVARVAFDHHERRFEIGEHYPFAELGKHEYEAYSMWRAGLLSVQTVYSDECKAKFDSIKSFGTAPPPPAQPKPTGRAARR